MGRKKGGGRLWVLRCVTYILDNVTLSLEVPLSIGPLDDLGLHSNLTATSPANGTAGLELSSPKSAKPHDAYPFNQCKGSTLCNSWNTRAPPALPRVTERQSDTLCFALHIQMIGSLATKYECNFAQHNNLFTRASDESTK